MGLGGRLLAVAGAATTAVLGSLRQWMGVGRRRIVLTEDPLIVLQFTRGSNLKQANYVR